jgi:hypothetical protein
MLKDLNPLLNTEGTLVVKLKNLFSNINVSNVDSICDVLLSHSDNQGVITCSVDLISIISFMKANNMRVMKIVDSSNQMIGETEKDFFDKIMQNVSATDKETMNNLQDHEFIVIFQNCDF